MHALGAHYTYFLVIIIIISFGGSTLYIFSCHYFISFDGSISFLNAVSFLIYVARDEWPPYGVLNMYINYVPRVHQCIYVIRVCMRVIYVFFFRMRDIIIIHTIKEP